MNANHLHHAVRAGLGLAALALLAGCTGGPSWGAWSKRPSDAEVAAVLARTEGQQVAQQPDAARPDTLVAATR